MHLPQRNATHPPQHTAPQHTTPQHTCLNAMQHNAPPSMHHTARQHTSSQHTVPHCTAMHLPQRNAMQCNATQQAGDSGEPAERVKRQSGGGLMWGPGRCGVPHIAGKALLWSRRPPLGLPGGKPGFHGRLCPQPGPAPPAAAGTSPPGPGSPRGEGMGVRRADGGAGGTLVWGLTAPSQGGGGLCGSAGGGGGMAGGRVSRPGLSEEDGGGGGWRKSSQLPAVPAATGPACPRPPSRLTGRRRGPDSTRRRKGDGKEGEAGCKPRSKLIINK